MLLSTPPPGLLPVSCDFEPCLDVHLLCLFPLNLENLTEGDGQLRLSLHVALIWPRDLEKNGEKPQGTGGGIRAV